MKTKREIATNKRVNGPSEVFGEMVKLSYPHIELYHSDLYVDAITLKELFEDRVHNQPITFIYAAKKTGTHLWSEEYCNSHWIGSTCPETAFRFEIRKRADYPDFEMSITELEID